MSGEAQTIALQLECERIQKNLDELNVTAPAFAVESGAGRDGAVRRRVEALISTLDTQSRTRLLDEWFGWGPIAPLLARDDATEILINWPDAIWFETKGKLQRHPDTFLSATTFRNFTLRLAREASMQPTLDCPFADGKWGDFRVHMALAPSASVPVAIALRRHPKSPWTFESLEAAEWASGSAMGALRTLVR